MTPSMTSMRQRRQDEPLLLIGKGRVKNEEKKRGPEEQCPPFPGSQISVHQQQARGWDQHARYGKYIGVPGLRYVAVRIRPVIGIDCRRTSPRAGRRRSNRQSPGRQRRKAGSRCRRGAPVSPACTQGKPGSHSAGKENRLRPYDERESEKYAGQERLRQFPFVLAFEAE